MDKKCKICGKNIFTNKKRCHYCNTKIRRIRHKIAGILLLGGKCQRCGYNENFIALDFHHKDGEEKIFSIGGVANKSWNVLKEEILKCELLCSNCHRIEHSKVDELLIKEVKNYNGNNLDFIDISKDWKEHKNV